MQIGWTKEDMWLDLLRKFRGIMRNLRIFANLCVFVLLLESSEEFLGIVTTYVSRTKGCFFCSDGDFFMDFLLPLLQAAMFPGVVSLLQMCSGIGRSVQNAPANPSTW